MVDPRIKELANILVNYSIKIKKGSVIRLSFGIEAKDLALECYKLITKKGAFARVNCGAPGFAYNFFKHATEDQLKKFPKISMFEAKNIDGVISIGGAVNTKELSTIDPRKISIYSKTVHPISNIVIKQNNWVGCEFPTNALAQDAEMSLEEFQDFVYGATNQDWKAESRRQTKLKEIIDKGSKVRIIGEETDLSFSIKGRAGIKCCGTRNMPDGEVFCGPVETSTEGHIAYSFPAIKNGREVDGIRLWFKKGKVVKATAEKNESFLKQMINTDKGAKYLGEFGIGTNYNLRKFVKQILFDEKIGGTIHLALGMAYPEGGGRNKSALHWDMIKDLRQKGEFLVDDKVIQRNGKFKIKL